MPWLVTVRLGLGRTAVLWATALRAGVLRRGVARGVLGTARWLLRRTVGAGRSSAAAGAGMSPAAVAATATAASRRRRELERMLITLS